MHASEWDLAGLRTDVLSQFGLKIESQELAGLKSADIEETIVEQLIKKYEEKEQMVGAEIMRETERMIMLHVIDDQWKDHLLSMDHLKEGIGLRGYGQKDPLVEYKKESFILFQDMMDRIEDETVRYLFFLQPVSGERAAAAVTSRRKIRRGRSPRFPWTPARAQRAAAQSSIQDFTRNIQRKKEREMAELQFVGGGTSTAQQPVVKGQKVGRNDPCPCGSGKKYKKCCGS